MEDVSYNLPIILSVPKEGESENDDYGNYHLSDNRVNSAGLSDGASGCSFSGEFSKNLVESLVNLENGKNNFKRYQNSIRDAIDKTNTYINEKIRIYENNSDLKSYLIAEKARMGACATILLVQINYRTNTFFCLWRGDTCLFQIRDRNIIAKIPHMDVFTNTPELVKTANNNVNFHREKKQNWKSGDIILLATDALAKWIYKNENNDNWEYFFDNFVLTANHETMINNFHFWVIDQRKNKLLEDDDTSCIIIRV